MSKKISLVIDRFEEGSAVLLTEKGEEIIFPEKYLPKASRESDVLKFEIDIDKETTRVRKKEIKDLIEKIKNKKHK